MSAAHRAEGLAGWSSRQGSGQVTAHAHFRARSRRGGVGGPGGPPPHSNSNRCTSLVFVYRPTSYLGTKRRKGTIKEPPIRSRDTTTRSASTSPDSTALLRGVDPERFSLHGTPQRGKVPTSLALVSRFLALHLAHIPAPSNPLHTPWARVRDSVSLPAPCCPRCAARA